MSEDEGRRLNGSCISVRGAQEHNLRRVDVDIPRGALVVVTGVSGSGKSSLAFDTVCAEGRRRFLETFSSYTRQFLGKIARPFVVSIDGLPPAVAVDQATTVGNPRSTVGTMTELYDLLRLLWARAGTVGPGADIPKIQRQLFSFNSPHGACPTCKGLGVEDQLDPGLLIADASKSIREGALRITTPTGYLIYSQVTLDVLDQVCRAHGFTVDVPWRDLTAHQRDIVLHGSDRIRIPYGKHPLESRLRWTGITAKPREEGVYRGILPVMEQILRQKRNDNILRFVRTSSCRACGGTRLRPEALAVTLDGLTIAQAAARSIDELKGMFASETGDGAGFRLGTLPGNPPRPRFQELERQITARCDVLQRLGLGYLTLDRESTTLSAGEAQRIRLARLAGIGLRGVLYVLDEPSVGLHHHDTAQLLEVLRGVRDEGNTVLVVEHDDQIIGQADWIVDVGPGAGSDGGDIIFSGPAEDFIAPDAETREPRLRDSRTRAFLTGRERIAARPSHRAGTGTIAVTGVTKHNLRGVDVTFTQGVFTVVTGVSGSGKSTLLEEVRRLLGGGAGREGAAGAAGAAGASAVAGPAISKVIEIDQSPIGRTPRSNPATYTGAFDHIRDLFAAHPEAGARGFGKGRFTFNVKGGRCDGCEGAGIQQVGMHFLGSVAVRCDICDGRRFNDDTLEIRLDGANIHDVLAMPLSDAARFFAACPPLARILDMLVTLGLGYLPLGHPATMLSGGEAQRVKLATELARAAGARTLYLLDEPTTGLHTADVALLLTAIDGLVAKGHTVIAIEHHLDVIRAADRVVDLGPGSGADGGRVMFSGTPEGMEAAPDSLTGAALREASPAARAPVAGPRGVSRADASRARAAAEPIRFTGVATHNLRGIDIEILRDRLTVITGVSGSGKSSLAFDTIFAEGQQRFADSFSTWARRFVQRTDAAEFAAVSGLTPAIAVRQQSPSRNPRSTVGTLTEIHDDYRLLFSRFGDRFCPRCATMLTQGQCSGCGFRGVPTLTASMFSPNAEAGACPSCRGLGHLLACDPDRLITDPSKPLAGGAMDGHKTGRFYGDPRGQHMATLAAAAARASADVSPGWADLDERTRQLALYGDGGGKLEVEWQYQRGAREGSHRFTSVWPGLLDLVRQEYERKHADARGEAMAFLMHEVACQGCGGGRLKLEFLAVRLGGVDIHELLGRSIGDSLAFFATLDDGSRPLDDRARRVSADLRLDIVRRLTSLADAGLAYLSLDRPASTLSGGEAQRVRLAAQLRSGLTGITYVLDEPTIGLHPRDTQRLLSLLRGLRDEGNTVVVVEHDLDVMAAADHIIEIGPGAGRDGGMVVAIGTPAHVMAEPASKTGRYLRAAGNDASIRAPRSLSPGITLRGVTVHNLRDLDVEIPSGGLIVITGVSGSGKSSLVFDVLAPSVSRVIERSGGTAAAPVHCRDCVVDAGIRRVIDVQSAGTVSSPWSTVATDTGVFDGIRERFAATAEAAARGLKKADFVTTAPGGRCDACEGLGEIRISMDFLPDVRVTCEDCGGTRYGEAVLACRVDGRHIADVLEMTVDEARAFVGGSPGLKALSKADMRLAALQQVGLGYVRLGQPVRTLSGGERQRLALASALGGGRSEPALYLFDEPTRGLHPEDVERLRAVFDGLIAAGHTLVVVEHNLEVIRHADWVIDLGPEGGAAGGRLMAAGPPAVIEACEASHTGRALRVARAAVSTLTDRIGRSRSELGEEGTLESG